MQAVVWLGILAVLLIIEMATLGLTTIWFAGGALIAFIAALCGAPIWLQITLFVIISVILLIFTRPVAMRYMNQHLAKTNLESIPGKIGVVKEEIDNIRGTGQVVVNGLEWTARTKKEECKLAKGTVVQVIAIEGVKLIVKEKKEES